VLTRATDIPAASLGALARPPDWERASSEGDGSDDGAEEADHRADIAKYIEPFYLSQEQKGPFLQGLGEKVASLEARPRGADIGDGADDGKAQEVRTPGEGVGQFREVARAQEHGELAAGAVGKEYAAAKDEEILDDEGDGGDGHRDKDEPDDGAAGDDELTEIGSSWLRELS